MYIALYASLLDILSAIAGCGATYLPYDNNYGEIIGSSFVYSIPALLAWLTGIIFGVIMLRRGGAGAEKLFLAGCSLMFVNKFMSPFLIAGTQWLNYEYGYNGIEVSVLMQALPYAVFSLSGILCIVYAFWLQFREKAPQD